MTATDRSAAQNGIQYEVAIEGLADRSLREDLQSVSDTFSLRDRHPPTLNLLRSRAEKDLGSFMKVLRARGYYGAKIDIEINSKAQPVQVTFNIKTGPAYVFKSATISILSKTEDLTLPSPQELGLIPGEPARAKVVIDARQNLLDKVKSQGYPFPQMEQPRVVVDHRRHDVAVTYEIDPGPPARFGSTTVTGLQTVSQEVVLQKIPWHKNEKFDASLLTKFQERLTATKLFSIVRVDHAEKLGRDGLLPITVDVTERKHRSVRAGASWSSDEGFGGKLSWENRNLFHHGERLSLGVVASQIDLAVQSAFEVPFFLQKDQTLAVNFSIADENTDAYDSKNVGGTVLINRKFGEKTTLGAGLGFRSARVTQLDQTKDFQLLYLPAHFDWDTSNNLLDPIRGGRLNVKVAPYYDLSGNSPGFFKGFVVYSHYFKLMEKPFVLFAGRIAAGSIAGAAFDDIPADLRFYAGGGGSIRGYAYQRVGPLVNGDPVGGRSIFEMSAELRFKVTESIGFVTFLDGGTAFESTYPNFDETIRWGAGPGVRYSTPIGPLRLDIGFPLNKRSGIDADYQIYVSIGQAF